MMSNKNTRSNLTVIKNLCDDLEGVFEAFKLDKYWNEDRDKITICFTAEQIKETPEIYTRKLLR